MKKMFSGLNRTGVLPILVAVLGVSCTTQIEQQKIAFTTRSQTSPPQSRTAEETDASMKARVREAYSNLPLHFEANQGQTDDQVKFLSRGNGYSLFLTSTDAVLTLGKTGGKKEGEKEESGTLQSTVDSPPAPSVGGQSAVLRMQLLGANPAPQVMGLGELPGKTNYFTSDDPTQWRTNIPTYAKVKYQGVYPGVDLVYYGNQRQLEYDFIVAPGADPKAITLAFTGADTLEIDAQGDFVLHTAGDLIRMQRPVIY